MNRRWKQLKPVSCLTKIKVFGVGFLLMSAIGGSTEVAAEPGRLNSQEIAKDSRGFSKVLPS